MNTFFLRGAIFLLWIGFAALLTMLWAMERVGFLARWSDRELLFAAGFATLLAAWNGFRLAFPRFGRGKARPAGTTKVAPRERPFEYNPDLDFFKPETPAK